jgi:hypothetical protein
MKADYLQLTDGRKVRVEWNMNSLGDFTKLTGIEMTDLANNKADINMLRTIAWCCAVEGEEADGRSLNLSEKELGRLIDMSGVLKFAQIFAQQSSNMTEKKSEAPSKSPRIFFRRKD